MSDRRYRRPHVWRGGLALAVALVVLSRADGTQDAVANGDTRTLSLFHTHSKESATITFRRNGQYDADGLKQLNHLLRDWRNDNQTRMDPRLFDVIWAAYRESGSSEPINIVSAYRSPDTNAMLRRRSRGVAENSQHMSGKAMDFFLTDVGMDKVRAIGMRLQQGGVGFYPNSQHAFVHLDVGSVRSWPRMTHDQLVRLFPDGKTVHLPSNGKPLAGYELAKAEILSRGGTVAGATYAEGGETGRRRSLWATLFGSEDEDAEVARPAPTTRLAARSVPLPATASDDGGTRGVPVASAPIPQPRPAAPPAAASPPQTEEASPWSKLIAAVGTDDKVEGSEPDRSRVLAFAPVPPNRPAEMPSPTVDLPLPPLRPLTLVALDPAVVTAVVGAEIGSGVPHALPPARPGIVPGIGAATPSASIALEERSALRALFLAVPSEPMPRRDARLTTLQVRRTVRATIPIPEPGTAIRMGFSKGPAAPDARRFSGRAVARLALLR